MNNDLDCRDENCHCKAYGILCLLVGRQQFCPACGEDLQASFEQTTLIEMPVRGEAYDAEQKLIPIHIGCLEIVRAVRDQVMIENLVHA